jgi:hypothetical protein
MILLCRGDQSHPLAESASLVAAGELEDRTVLYRHDLYFKENPSAVKNSHSVYRFVSAATRAVTEAIQNEFWEFLSSEGRILRETSPYLEAPMRSGLPLDLDFIP